MDGIKEKNELLSEFNHSVKNLTEEQELGLGFQSLDFADQGLDHELMGVQDDGLAKKLSEMAIEGSLSGEEEVSELVFAIEMDERKSETEEGFDKDGNFRKEIGVENDQDGDFGVEGFKDSGGEDKEKIEKEKPDKWSVVEVNVGEIGGVKEGGGDKEGSKWYDNLNRVGDHDLDGINNDEAKIKERKSGKFSVVEGNEGDYKEMKEGGKDKEGSEWSEIKNEVGDRDLEGIKDEAKIKERKLEKRSWVEGNEGDFKEMKEGNTDKEGIKWREFEDKEENYNLEVKNKRVEKGKQVIEDYEDGWGENWDDGAGRTEVNEEQQYFNNYEDEKNVNEQYGELYGNAEGDLVRRDGKGQYDEEPHWFGNAQRDSVGLNDRNFGRVYYPLRPDAEDCSFYMRTGTCKFGPNCKFNHPLKRKNQAARDTLQQKEEIYDRPKPTECKYYLSSGGCKYGKACKFYHSKGKAAVTPNSELNFLGLPIRVGEKECPFYMRNGSCKYGSNCRFHHPDPTVAGGGDTASPGRHSTSARTLNETAPFRPAIHQPGPSAPPNAEWNGYQAPVYRTSERNLPVPPAFSMNIPATGSNFYAHPRTQLMVDEFPERPGQPECNFYLKTGDCKYRSACKFHHPKNPTTSVTLNDHGLPLRPGQSICSHFRHYGICKFGPSCRYDHSVTNGTSVSSDGSVQGPPILYTVGDEYGEWQTESMRSV